MNTNKKFNRYDTAKVLRPRTQMQMVDTLDEGIIKLHRVENENQTSASSEMGAFTNISIPKMNFNK